MAFLLRPFFLISVGGTAGDFPSANDLVTLAGVVGGGAYKECAQYVSGVH